jgi:hypothetical protein
MSFVTGGTENVKDVIQLQYLKWFTKHSLSSAARGNRSDLNNASNIWIMAIWFVFCCTMKPIRLEHYEQYLDYGHMVCLLLHDETDQTWTIRAIFGLWPYGLSSAARGNRSDLNNTSNIWIMAIWDVMLLWSQVEGPIISEEYVVTTFRILSRLPWRW